MQLSDVIPFSDADRTANFYLVEFTERGKQYRSLSQQKLFKKIRTAYSYKLGYYDADGNGYWMYGGNIAAMSRDEILNMFDKVNQLFVWHNFEAKLFFYKIQK